MKTYLFTLIVIAFLAAFCDADAGGETGSSKILAEIPAATLQQNMIWMEAAPTSEGEPIFVAFRKTFALDAQPNTAELRILLTCAISFGSMAATLCAGRFVLIPRRRNSTFWILHRT